MSAMTPTNWPSARHFTEALQCPTICFSNPYLRDTLPAVDKLGMPLVTSGQFAYVYKLNRPEGGAWAVRCFRSFLSDRQQRYAAFDTHFRENFLAALPRFAYEPEGLLIGGRRYPILVMEWLAAPTLDSYVGKVLDKPDVLQHLADEWVRLMAELREAGVAHGDLQHGNILVQNGGFRLVDLDGMYVPALKGLRACEVGHQHFQHPRRAESWFHDGLDNFSALSIYISLKALAERPSFWQEHHDENLLFTKADFQQPDKSSLFARLRELGGEHQELTELLISACRADKPHLPALDELVAVKEETSLPAWMTAPEGAEVVTRTREAARPAMPPPTRPAYRPWYAEAENIPLEITMAPVPPLSSNQAQPIASSSVQTIFGSVPQQPRNPNDLWGNTLFYAGQGTKTVFSKIGAFWIILLFSSIWIRLITGFWSLFGVDAAGAFFLTFLLGVLGFLAYGFLCALELSGNAANTPAMAGSGGAPGQPVLSPPVAPAAALPPAQPSNIPWYRQSAQPAPARPLSPGARRAPDWAVAAKQSPPSPTPAKQDETVVGYQGSYHLPECDTISSLSSALLTRYNAPLKAQKDGLQPCAECNPYAWPFAVPAAPPAAPTKPAPVPPKPAPTAPAAKKTVINPVIANRDTGAYHRPDCEDAVITPKDVTIKFDSLGEAELAGFRRCQTCKPSSRAMPRNAPQQAVVGNKNTNIYHRPECEWANAIGHSKRVKFNSPSDAEGSGYHRCLTCRPGENVAAGTVIGDRDKMVFHRASCDLLDRVEYRWQVKFDKVADAAQANYQPCPVCHP